MKATMQELAGVQELATVLHQNFTADVQITVAGVNDSAGRSLGSLLWDDDVDGYLFEMET